MALSAGWRFAGRAQGASGCRHAERSTCPGLRGVFGRLAGSLGAGQAGVPAYAEVSELYKLPRVRRIKVIRYRPLSSEDPLTTNELFGCSR